MSLLKDCKKPLGSSAENKLAILQSCNYKTIVSEHYPIFQIHFAVKYYLHELPQQSSATRQIYHRRKLSFAKPDGISDFIKL